MATVERVWTLYDKGFANYKSIKEAELDNSITALKYDASKRKALSRFMQIVNAVRKEAIMKNITPEEAALNHDRQRIALPNRSLNNYLLHLQREGTRAGN